MKNAFGKLFNNFLSPESDDSYTDSVNNSYLNSSSSTIFNDSFSYETQNARNKNGKTALYKAVLAENIESVDDLIKNNADVNISDNFGNSPLHIAAALDNSNILRKLITADAKLDIQNKDGETALHFAVKYGKIENVGMLLTQNPTLINIKTFKESYRRTDTGFESPLHYALQTDALDFTQKEIHENYIKIIMKLLDYGADINQANRLNITCFNMIISSPYINDLGIETIQKLLNKADLLLANHDCIILQAAKNNNISKEIFELILNAYANQVSSEELSKGLELAVEASLLNNHIECLKTLIQAGANPNIHISLNKKNKINYLEDGDTPLHYAVKYEDYELAKLCLEKDPSMVNNANCKGLTPPAYAIKILSPKMANILSNANNIQQATEAPGIKNDKHLTNDERYNTLLMQAVTRGIKSQQDLHNFFTNPEYCLSETQLKMREKALAKYPSKYKEKLIVSREENLSFHEF